MFQFILGGILSFFVVKLKRLIFPDHKNFGAEILLLLLANLHPFLLHYQFNVIHPVMLDSTMFISLLYVGMYYAKKEERGALDYLLLATITGICFLERFTLITALLPLIWLEFKRREKWRTVLILFASFLIFFVPWMSRNYFYTGKFQMTSGIHRYLWVGIQEETEGTNTLEQGESYYELFLDEVKLEWSGMTIDEQLSFYRTEYRETFRGDFSHVLKMWGIKVKNYFWFSKSFKNRFENNKDLLLLLMAARFMLLLSIPPAFILGYRSLRLLALTVIALGVLQGFFYIESRHFVPSIGVLMVVFLSSTLKIKKRLSLRNAKEMV